MVLAFSELELLEFKQKHPDSVILIADETKNPGSFMGSWNEIEPQTPDEINQLLYRVRATNKVATNWGIRTGTNDYWGSDFEWSWVYRIWRDTLGDRAETLTIETANGGKRPVYLTSEVEKEWGEPYKNNIRFEVKNKGYVILGGSAKDIQGNDSKYRIVKDLPIKRDNKIIKDTLTQMKKILEKAEFLDYHCLKTLDKKLRMTHDQRLAILPFMILEGWPDSAIHNFFQDVHEVRGKNDYRRSTTQAQINSGRKYVKNDGKPKPCTKHRDNQTTLHQVFNLKKGICNGCPRRINKHPSKRFQDDDDEFNAVRFVNYLLTKHDYITPMNDQGGDTVFRYHPDKGIWVNDGLPYAEQELEKWMGEETKTKYYNHIVKHLQVKTYTKPEDFEPTPEIMVLENGSFNLETGELMDHDPTYYQKNQIPITHKPEADCPKFKQFIKQVLPNSVKFYQEWLGYHLLKDYRFQRVVVCLGDGDNGKSTLLNVQTRFLGVENIASQTLYRLSTNRFSPAELYEKLGNIVADIGPDELRYTGTIKMLTGGDWFSAERKNRDPFKFKNYAKLTFSCNQLPKTPDETLAFFKRFIVLAFNDPIPIEKQDPDLLEKLTTPEELSGLFNWAHEGIKRALERGRLAEAGDATERKELYLAMSDPVTGFYNQHISEEDPTYIEIKEDVWMSFLQYCKKKGFVPYSDKKFYGDFKKTAYFRETRPTLYSEAHPKGKRTRCYTGIKLIGYERSEYYYTEDKYKTAKGIENGEITTLDDEKNNPVQDVPDVHHPQTRLKNEKEEEERRREEYIEGGHEGHGGHEQSREASLVKKATELLKQNNKNMRQQEFWEYLRKQGYPDEESRILRSHKYAELFAFQGLRVLLKGGGE